MSQISLSGCSSASGASPTLPPELRGLTGLRSLAIVSSHLVGSVPAEYSEMTALDSLHIFSNQLTGEPRSSPGSPGRGGMCATQGAARGGVAQPTRAGVRGWS